MWGGVLIGLEGMKFSGSINNIGKKRVKNIQTINIITNPKKSFLEKY
jgi:hypothetical protein